MPITPTLQVDPTMMTNNWSAGLAAPTNAAKLVHKYTHPKRVFNYNPALQQADYLNGVQRAATANKYANGMAGADLNAAADNMTKYGATNWSNAGTAKKYKYARKAASLANAINTVLANVEAMPKGRGANNRARMMAWFDQMSAYYGKITPS
jgi:hypothetical protein